MKIFLAALIFCFTLQTASGQTDYENSGKIGLDRIDAAYGQSASADWPAVLMEKTAQTGVKHIKFVALWLNMDPLPPSGKRPREHEGYLVVPCVRTETAVSGCWHQYYVGAMDRAMAEARKWEMDVTMGIHGPPLWPRGGDCGYDVSTFLPCGDIKQNYFEIFRNALFDFSFYMAERYGGEVKFWIVYNEPNLRYSFIPEKPYPGGTLLNAYIDLVYWPMADGLRATGREVKLVGPEITLLNVENGSESTRWLEDWIIPVLRDYPGYFDVIGVHNYAVDAEQTLKKMARLKEALSQYPGAAEKVWLTEFNFGTDKEPLTRTDVFVFSNLLKLYSRQWWERSYFFSAMGSLFYDDPERFGRETPLYWMFKIMVQFLN